MSSGESWLECKQYNMEENKDDDNEKEVNDTDDVKNGDFQKTIMLNRHRLRQSGESQSDSLPLVQILLRTM